jgi:hypothetical protein
MVVDYFQIRTTITQIMGRQKTPTTRTITVEVHLVAPGMLSGLDLCRLHSAQMVEAQLESHHHSVASGD